MQPATVVRCARELYHSQGPPVTSKPAAPSEQSRAEQSTQRTSSAVKGAPDLHPTRDHDRQRQAGKGSEIAASTQQCGSPGENWNWLVTWPATVGTQHRLHAQSTCQGNYAKPLSGRRDAGSRAQEQPLAYAHRRTALCAGGA